MSGLSTHVLDAVDGAPAAGMRVRLFRAEEGEIASGITDEDGRIAALLGEPLPAAEYRLEFDTGDYFDAKNTPTFYPIVSISFTVAGPAAHHHVPLLLSPFAYSTYRGS
ncbi:MAG: hydroxyisourate hydrolase [Rhodococcus sp. (in: high G+C Gram-positive bacteria)]